MFRTGSKRKLYINILRPYKVIIAIIVIWSFLFNTVFQGIVLQDLAWAYESKLELLESEYNDKKVKKLTFDIERFSLPLNLGEIKEVYKSPNKGPTIIHIQDAHCNYSCQKSVFDILDYLNNRYGIELVTLEGGSGDYDLSLFTGIKDINIRRKVADYFVKEGRINGVEFYAIQNPQKLVLKGVEEPRLYFENLKVYRNSLKYGEIVDNHIHVLDKYIVELKSYIYSAELTKLDEKVISYHKNKDVFKDYLLYIFETAEDNGVDVTGFENLSSMRIVLNAEESIDFRTCNTEKEILIDEIVKRLSEFELENLVKKAFELKTGKISASNFYSYLVKKALNLGIGLEEKYPNLTRFKDYIEAFDSLDKIALFRELEKLEEGLAEKLCENETQKKLYQLSRRLEILKGLFSISLTPKQFSYYDKNRDLFNLSEFISFINKEAPKYDISYKLNPDISELDTYREKTGRFYHCSYKRDVAFIRHLKRYIKERREAIFISGGFHAENIKDLFKKAGYSYVVIVPTMKVERKTPYHRLLSGGKSQIEEMISENISALALLSMFSEMKVMAKDEKELLRMAVDAMVALGEYQSVEFPTRSGLATFSREKNRAEAKKYKINGYTVYAWHSGDDPRSDSIMTWQGDMPGSITTHLVRRQSSRGKKKAKKAINTFPVNKWINQRIKITYVNSRNLEKPRTDEGILVGGDGKTDISLEDVRSGRKTYNSIVYHIEGSVLSIETPDGTIWEFTHNIEAVRAEIEAKAKRKASRKSRPRQKKRTIWNEKKEEKAREAAQRIFWGSSLDAEDFRRLALAILNNAAFITDDVLGVLDQTPRLKTGLKKAIRSEQGKRVIAIIEEASGKHQKGKAKAARTFAGVSGQLPKGESRTRVRNLYDEASISRLEGPILFKRQLSPYEMAYVYERNAYIVWTEGDQKNRIYRIIPRPPARKFSHLLSMEEIHAEVDSRLVAINTLESQRKHSKARQARAELYIYLHKLYHGDDKTIGLDTAQIFAENSEYNHCLTVIQEIGLREWLRRRAEDQELHEVGIDPETCEEEEFNTLERFYNGSGVKLIYGDFDWDNEVVLLHATYSDLLSVIIQLRKLACKSYFESRGIKKLFGGESGRSLTSTPNRVSFRYHNPEGTYYHLSGPQLRIGGYGMKRGFEYPIGLGIALSQARAIARQYRLALGAARDEVTVQDFVTSDEITHLVVPYFAMEETRDMLREHELGHIKVVPFIEFDHRARTGGYAGLPQRAHFFMDETMWHDADAHDRPDLSPLRAQPPTESSRKSTRGTPMLEEPFDVTGGLRQRFLSGLSGRRKLVFSSPYSPSVLLERAVYAIVNAVKGVFINGQTPKPILPARQLERQEERARDEIPRMVELANRFGILALDDQVFVMPDRYFIPFQRTRSLSEGHLISGSVETKKPWPREQTEIRQFLQMLGSEINILMEREGFTRTELWDFCIFLCSRDNVLLKRSDLLWWKREDAVNLISHERYHVLWRSASEAGDERIAILEKAYQDLCTDPYFFTHMVRLFSHSDIYSAKIREGNFAYEFWPSLASHPTPYDKEIWEERYERIRSHVETHVPEAYRIHLELAAEAQEIAEGYYDKFRAGHREDMGEVLNRRWPSVMDRKRSHQLFFTEVVEDDLPAPDRRKSTRGTASPVLDEVSEKGDELDFSDRVTRGEEAMPAKYQIPSDTGQVRLALLQYRSFGIGDIYKRIIEGLNRDARFIVIPYDRRSEEDLKDWIRQKKMDPERFLFCKAKGKPEEPLQIWARDTCLFINTPRGVKIVLPDYDPGMRYQKAWLSIFGLFKNRDSLFVEDTTAVQFGDLELQLDTIYPMIKWGNVICDGDVAFIDTRGVAKNNEYLRDWSKRNQEEKILRECRKYFGNRIELIDNPLDCHLDLCATVLPDKVVLIGDPRLGARYVTEDWLEIWNEAGEKVDGHRVSLDLDVHRKVCEEYMNAADILARQYKKKGYTVKRIPLILGAVEDWGDEYDDSGSLQGHDMKIIATYNNPIFDGNTVLMPVYDNAEADEAARRVYEELGYEVIPIPALELINHGGAGRCLVPVCTQPLKRSINVIAPKTVRRISRPTRRRSARGSPDEEEDISPNGRPTVPLSAFKAGLECTISCSRRVGIDPVSTQLLAAAIASPDTVRDENQIVIRPWHKVFVNRCRSGIIPVIAAIVGMTDPVRGGKIIVFDRYPAARTDTRRNVREMEDGGFIKPGTIEVYEEGPERLDEEVDRALYDAYYRTVERVHFENDTEVTRYIRFLGAHLSSDGVGLLVYRSDAQGKLKKSAGEHGLELDPVWEPVRTTTELVYRIKRRQDIRPIRIKKGHTAYYLDRQEQIKRAHNIYWSYTQGERRRLQEFDLMVERAALKTGLTASLPEGILRSTDPGIRIEIPMPREVCAPLITMGVVSLEIEKTELECGIIISSAIEGLFERFRENNGRREPTFLHKSARVRLEATRGQYRISVRPENWFGPNSYNWREPDAYMLAAEKLGWRTENRSTLSRMRNSGHLAQTSIARCIAHLINIDCLRGTNEAEKFVHRFSEETYLHFRRLRNPEPQHIIASSIGNSRMWMEGESWGDFSIVEPVSPTGAIQIGSEVRAVAPGRVEKKGKHWMVIRHNDGRNILLSVYADIQHIGLITRDWVNDIEGDWVYVGDTIGLTCIPERKQEAGPTLQVVLLEVPRDELSNVLRSIEHRDSVYLDTEHLLNLDRIRRYVVSYEDQDKVSIEEARRQFSRLVQMHATELDTTDQEFVQYKQKWDDAHRSSARGAKEYAKTLFEARRQNARGIQPDANVRVLLEFDSERMLPGTFEKTAGTIFANMMTFVRRNLEELIGNGYAAEIVPCYSREETLKELGRVRSDEGLRRQTVVLSLSDVSESEKFKGDERASALKQMTEMLKIPNIVMNLPKERSGRAVVDMASLAQAAILAQEIREEFEKEEKLRDTELIEVLARDLLSIVASIELQDDISEKLVAELMKGPDALYDGEIKIDLMPIEKIDVSGNMQSWYDSMRALERSL